MPRTAASVLRGRVSPRRESRPRIVRMVRIGCLAVTASSRRPRFRIGCSAETTSSRSARSRIGCLAGPRALRSPTSPTETTIRPRNDVSEDPDVSDRDEDPKDAVSEDNEVSDRDEDPKHAVSEDNEVSDRDEDPCHPPDPWPALSAVGGGVVPGLSVASSPAHPWLSARSVAQTLFTTLIPPFSSASASVSGSLLSSRCSHAALRPRQFTLMTRNQ
jgi:hypothetical protein